MLIMVITSAVILPKSKLDNIKLKLKKTIFERSESYREVKALPWHRDDHGSSPNTINIPQVASALVLEGPRASSTMSWALT